MRESAREDGGYLSRESAAGKRPFTLPRTSSILFLTAFSAAAWANNWPLSLLATVALMWRLPFRPLTSPRSEAARAASARAAAGSMLAARDLPFVVPCFVLATWALWQHRLLPLAVCVAAIVLAILDAHARGHSDAEAPGLAERSTR